MWHFLLKTITSVSPWLLCVKTSALSSLLFRLYGLLFAVVISTSFVWPLLICSRNLTQPNNLNLNGCASKTQFQRNLSSQSTCKCNALSASWPSLENFLFFFFWGYQQLLNSVLTPIINVSWIISNNEYEGNGYSSKGLFTSQ